ncbi:HAD family hydrolase [Chamaesiphon polymorphus]|uniref:HAD family hydrolase n=1 Tax=Chamaesiphon polymorphus CCALA 037 TaxID=2107692 RepID=A0A2T1GJ72_9CYAN|nr:HAD hydrolase-like protein [Chamaesiphon polymorphus]PSB57843.1 HAD family hydrolase [Chamaesiphon polymorphus CCALA 037]
MHLIMFDLDGTLVDSNPVDSQCYLQALVDVFGFDLDNIDRNWGNYPHVTDAGILQTLCQVELGRVPTEIEIDDYQCRFLELLVLAVSQKSLQSIAGAREILERLSLDSNYALSMATGAWKQTADYKLQQTGLDGIISPIAYSDDARARVEIMKCAYRRSLEFYRQSQFETVTYLGDGVWDGIASKQLNYNFIGIGTGKRAVDLLATGARSVFPHYLDISEIMSVLST